MVAFSKSVTDSQTCSIVHVTEPAIEKLKDVLERLGVLGNKCFRIEARSKEAEMTLDTPKQDDITLRHGLCTLLAMDTESVRTLADRVLHYNDKESEFYWLRLIEVDLFESDRKG